MDLPNISTKRETLSDHAYQVLRNAIVTLKLQPGQQVYEMELGNTLGVSRTPIREAFRRLMAEELIVVQPQRGAQIAYISKRKIAESRFVRVSLEVNAFKEVAKQWNQDDFRFKRLYLEVEDILERQKKMVDEQDVEAFFELDEKFHYTILETTGNSTLIAIINLMRGHLNRMRYIELQETKHMLRLVDEHEAIFKSMVSNQPEQTERLLSEHILLLESDTDHLVEKYPQYFRP